MLEERKALDGRLPIIVENRPRGTNLWVGLAFGVLVMAAFLRLVGLDHPARMYFDEVYYAQDALVVAEQGVEERRPSHPALGPVLIALGVKMGGGEPWSWRIVPAIAGTTLVGFTYLLGRRLGLSAPLAVGAMALVAVDGLAITMSRIAMLDIFVASLVTMGIWALAGALQAQPGTRRWSVLVATTGAFMGLASSVKWSGLFALAAAGVLTLGQVGIWVARRAAADARTIVRSMAVAALALGFLPAAIYLGSHLGWFLNYEASAAYAQRCPVGDCTTGWGERLDVWWDEQIELVDYHRRLPATHPYRSEPQSWPLLTRPVLYYFEHCPGGETGCAVAPGEQAKILGLGNPVLWWTALLAWPVVAWDVLRHRSGRAAVLAIFATIQFLPWFAVSKPGYLFYAAPLVPLSALAVAISTRAFGRWSGRALATIVVLAAVSAVYFSPLWYGIAMPKAALDARMWLGSWR